MVRSARHCHARASRAPADPNAAGARSGTLRLPRGGRRRRRGHEPPDSLARARAQRDRRSCAPTTAGLWGAGLALDVDPPTGPSTDLPLASVTTGAPLNDSAPRVGGVGGGSPRQQPAHPQYANYWAPLTRKRYTTPHPAQPRHTNHRAPRTRKRHQQEHRPQRPTERSAPTQHAKGRAGDCPGPRKETTTRRTVTQAPPPPPTSPGPPPPFLSDGAKFFSGPSANQNFSVAPSAQVSLGQELSSAPLGPLKAEHLRGWSGWAGGGGGTIRRIERQKLWAKTGACGASRTFFEKDSSQRGPDPPPPAPLDPPPHNSVKGALGLGRTEWDTGRGAGVTGVRVPRRRVSRGGALAACLPQSCDGNLAWRV